MSNSIAPGSSADVNVRVTALTTNPNVPVTYKTIILKKNLVNGVNTLTQEMMYAQNTKYVVKYDYILGEDIDVPTNCVLEFDGGSISGSNTYNIINIGKIVNYSNKTIFKNTSFINPAKQEVKTTWFSNNTVKDTIEQACKFGIVDGLLNTYTLDGNVIVNNDLTIKNVTFNCIANTSIYDYKNFAVESPDSTTIEYNQLINAGATSIQASCDNKYTHAIIRSSDVFIDIDPGTPARHSKRGEMMEIKKQENGYIYFTDATVLGYTSGITVTFIKIINANFYNVKFLGVDNPNNLDTLGNLLENKYCKSYIENCEFKGNTTGLYLVDCFNTIVTGCDFHDIYPWGLLFADSTCYSMVTTCKFRNHRHGVACSGEQDIAKFNTIKDCIVEYVKIGLNHHTGGYGVTIQGNTFTHCLAAINVSCPNANILNNVITDAVAITGDSNPQIHLDEGGFINPTIKGNLIKNTINSGIFIAPPSNITVGGITPLTIDVSDNTIIKTIGEGILIDLNLYSSLISVLINNNTVYGCSYTAIKAVNMKRVFVNNNDIYISTDYYPALRIEGENLGTEYNHFRAYINNNKSDQNGTEGTDSASLVVKYIDEIFYGLNIFNSMHLPNNAGATLAFYSDYQIARTHTRPTDLRASRYSRCMIYDPTDNKPIWWNGTTWVDATGTSV